MKIYLPAGDVTTNEMVDTDTIFEEVKGWDKFKLLSCYNRVGRVIDRDKYSKDRDVTEYRLSLLEVAVAIEREILSRMSR